MGTIREAAETYISTLNWVLVPVRMMKVPHVDSNGKDTNKRALGKWRDIKTSEQSLKLDFNRKEIGLAVICEPSRICVVDLDIAKENDISKNVGDGLKYMKAQFDICGTPQTVCARTPSGGLHYYFQFNEQVKQGAKFSFPSVGSFPAGKYSIDIRSKGGYIIVPPTYNPQKDASYEWINSPNDYDIEEMPDWMVSLFSSKNSKTRNLKRILYTESTEDSLFSKVRFALMECWKYTSPNPSDPTKEDPMTRDEWVQTGMRLKALAVANPTDYDNYRELFHEWSQRGDTLAGGCYYYTPETCESQWNSFNPERIEKPLSMIFWKAKRDNYDLWTEKYHLISEFVPKYKFSSYIVTLLIDSRIDSYAELFVLITKGKCFFLNTKEVAWWNEEIKLWETLPSCHLLYIISKILLDVVDRYEWVLRKKTEESRTEKEKAYLKNSFSLKQTVTNPSTAQSVLKFLPSLITNKNLKSILNNHPEQSHLLPIYGGRLLDLKTGAIRSRDQTHLFSFELQFDPGLATEKDIEFVDSFFLSLMCGNSANKDYLRKVLAFSITNENPDRKFFVCLGTGSNGKSLLLSLMHRLLGEFAVTANSSLLVGDAKGHFTDQTRGNPFLLDIIGRRFASISELPQGSHIRSDIFKRLTGGDELSVRDNFGTKNDIIKFVNTSKLMLASNYAPEFNTKDEATVDRIRYIPFEATFVTNPRRRNEYKIDRHLLREFPMHALLAYLAKEAQSLYSSSLLFDFALPSSLASKKSELLETVNPVLHFAREYIVHDPQSSVSFSFLKTMFDGLEYDRTFSPRSFTIELKKALSDAHAELFESEPPAVKFVTVKGSATIKGFKYVDLEHDPE